MEEGHSGKLRSKINMAIDCLRRAHDGMESESWPYVLDQLGKATLNVAESAFLADTCKLLHERSVMDRLKAFRGRVCP